MNTELNLVKNIFFIENPGDACIVGGIHSETKKKIKQLAICCPSCGELSSSAGNHIFNEETNSYTPSIVHDTDLGGCGWHGWLTNGVFTTC